MNHHTTSAFWDCCNALPESIRRLADANYQRLQVNPRHPSLHFKQIETLWSVRVGIGYRALAVNMTDGPLWFWIGSHAEYNRIVRTFS